ncbi:SAM-dependent methyltransferase [Stutzerimonas kirkiae]|uniref:SAM-dependent methyltransferase n=1 Tax=Stutzerimonas kirkiae TaxID=2211392 RepID=A0A4Q9R440_9GAMM|nr:class I SAM-dependent methyltransferase [Stutzerimonas kirkiae]TBU92865.1 SAM-dependent methyltransferase [Stutzerimonas kirkiae]TBV01328.1 SAM-dependent methyltransferase [Stutzerimonas kirkiae]
MQNDRSELLVEVAGYYATKLAAYGETARGVDWSSEAGQHLRFEQLCRIVNEGADGFSLNDLGCGYGALLDFLSGRYTRVSYLGVDVSEEMIQAACARHQGRAEGRFIFAARPDAPADYGIASGIFNVRLDRTNTEWQNYLQTTLDVLHETSRQGFAFNCLTSYSDADKMRSDLYYADPCELFDLCKRRYARNVALLHDYGLYEFTILVRKDS